MLFIGTKSSNNALKVEDYLRLIYLYLKQQQKVDRAIKTSQTKQQNYATKDVVLGVVKSLNLGTAIISQIEAILVIGGSNKIGLVPFICKMISEQSHYYYADTIHKFLDVIEVSNEYEVLLHLRPEIKDYIESTGFIEDDIELINFIDTKFRVEHPKEKIAYLYFMGKRGSLLGLLNSGSRLCMLDEDPEFLFDFPSLAACSLKKGIDLLERSESVVADTIRTSMQSLVIEARVKYIHSILETGGRVSELCNDIEWVLDNHPRHQRWLKLVSKTEALSELFNYS